MSIPFNTLSLSPQDWENILTTNLNVQSGQGIVGYRGLTPYQRGYGIGSILRTLFRIARPIIARVAPSAAKVAKAVAKEGIESAALLGADLIEGEDLKTSVKKRAKKGASNLLRKAVNNLPPRVRGYKRMRNQSGSGRRRKAYKKKKQSGRGYIGYKKKRGSIKRTKRNQLGYGKRRKARRRPKTKADYFGKI